MTSDLNRSLGSRQFLNVANERTVLHRARAHLKYRAVHLESTSISFPEPTCLLVSTKTRSSGIIN